MTVEPLSPDVMAQWVMARLDLAWPEHVALHHRADPRCPWCVIVFRTKRDLRSDEELLLASAGALS